MNWLFYYRCRSAFEQAYDETIREGVGAGYDLYSYPCGIDVWQEAVEKNQEQS